jgi:hypothetical protein
MDSLLKSATNDLFQTISIYANLHGKIIVLGYGMLLPTA